MALASVVDGLDCPPQTRSPKCSECYLPYFQSHDDRCHCTGHGSLPKFTSTLAPFAPPASGATRFPDFIAHIGPSDFHTLIGLGSGSPRLRPTSRRVASVATPLGVRLLESSYPRRDSRSVWGTGLRLPLDRICSRKGVDLPGYWVVLRVRAEVGLPRWMRLPLALSRGPLLPSRPASRAPPLPMIHSAGNPA